MAPMIRIHTAPRPEFLAHHLARWMVHHGMGPADIPKFRIFNLMFISYVTVRQIPVTPKSDCKTMFLLDTIGSFSLYIDAGAWH